MSNSGLIGPFDLDAKVVSTQIVKGYAGTYALGYKDERGRFCVTYVGSSAHDLTNKLCNHIGTAHLFKYRQFSTPQLAFEKECELFHDFTPTGNFLHPERPAGSNWACPRCQRGLSKRP